MQELAKRSSGGTSGYVRIIVSLASAVILTFFASQIYSAHDMKLPVKDRVILVIAAIGFGGFTRSSPRSRTRRPSCRNMRS